MKQELIVRGLPQAFEFVKQMYSFTTYETEVGGS